MSETFDSGFAFNVRYNSTSPTRACRGIWSTPAASSTPAITWGRVAGAPVTDTVWNAATTPPGAPPIAAGQPYTKNMQAYADLRPDRLDRLHQRVHQHDLLRWIRSPVICLAWPTRRTARISPGWRQLQAADPTWRSDTPTTIPASPAWCGRTGSGSRSSLPARTDDNIDALGVFVDDVVLRGYAGLQDLPAAHSARSDADTHANSDADAYTPAATIGTVHVRRRGVDQQSRLQSLGRRLDERLRH